MMCILVFISVGSSILVFFSIHRTQDFTKGARSEKKVKTYTRTIFMGKFNLDDRKLEIGLAREDFFVGLDESGREIFATESFGPSSTPTSRPSPQLTLSRPPES